MVQAFDTTIDEYFKHRHAEQDAKITELRKELTDVIQRQAISEPSKIRNRRRTPSLPALIVSDVDQIFYYRDDRKKLRKWVYTQGFDDVRLTRSTGRINAIIATYDGDKTGSWTSDQQRQCDKAVEMLNNTS